MHLDRVSTIDPRRRISFYCEREPLDFKAIECIARRFADFVEERRVTLEDILIRYESHEVAVDEMARTLDLLRSLHENEAYFKARVGPVATFLPRNQPLYALTCFGIVPSLMATEVHVKAARAMDAFFLDLALALSTASFFPNLKICRMQREAFVEERSATHRDPRSGRVELVTECVIFTGTMANADKLRKRFNPEVLFIANGAGHNPIVVTETADLEQAVRSAVRVQLYNSGQDCANPDAILVHDKVHDVFVALLRDVLHQVSIGSYARRENRVGPLSDLRTLLRVQEVFIDNAQWLNESTPGIIRTKCGIIEPTIIQRPLEVGGNYQEQFAPVLFVHRYTSDDQLGLYFEDARYPHNAMYVTVFGHSDYVDNKLLSLRQSGSPLHDDTTIIRNKDLHAVGVERGTQPYGGFGRGASCISIHGQVISKPTLPQRDIYEHLVAMRPPAALGEGATVGLHPELGLVDIAGTMKNASSGPGGQPARVACGQPHADKTLEAPRSPVAPRLLAERNSEHWARMSDLARTQIDALRGVLQCESASLAQIETSLYAIPVSQECSPGDRKERQKAFFADLYKLLFGSTTGPKLSTFLLQVDRAHVLRLLTS